MNEEVRLFLKSLVDDKTLDYMIIAEAKTLLERDLKHQTRNIFRFYLKDSCWDRTELRIAIRERDIVRIIGEVYLNTEARNFLNENWQELNKIIDFLNEYLDELEKNIEEAKYE